MKEYGVKDTWTKLYTISYIRSFHVSKSALCIYMTGEILLRRGYHLVLYNPNIGRFRHPKIGNLSHTLIDLDAFTFIESLVSPNLDEEVPSSHTSSRSHQANLICC